MTNSIQNVCHFLEEFAPLCMAEDWDNVGLLVGDSTRPAERIMTCLTVTPSSVAEAVQEQVSLLISHHPFPFRPTKRITHHNQVGRMLLQLIEARVAVYSPHTAFDSCRQGINQQLAAQFHLEQIQPINQFSDGKPEIAELGSGRMGLTSVNSQGEFVQTVKQALQLERVKFVGSPTASCRKIAVACGSAGEFLQPAHRAGCDLLVTGETTFHTVLDAEAKGMGLILTGHYASERFAVEQLAQLVAEQFPDNRVWASQQESDPIQYL